MYKLVHTMTGLHTEYIQLQKYKHFNSSSSVSSCSLTQSYQCSAEAHFSSAYDPHPEMWPSHFIRVIISATLSIIWLHSQYNCIQIVIRVNLLMR